ncbi:MAG: NUDIX hydrolase [Phycisphaerales bacterium]|nr:MAG: NUDIX hydrolase [Phycisphaerales bacterium]
MSRDCDIETPHQGRLFSVEVRTYRDEQGREITREIVRHPGAVLIVPVLNEQKLILIRNYRIAPDQTLWEFPAGKLEPGEDPRNAALRELEEETGYSAARIEPLGTFYTSPGFADELMHVFVAEELSEVGQRLEPGEEIEVHLIGREDALEMATDGRMQDGKSIAALFMWNHARRIAAR